MNAAKAIAAPDSRKKIVGMAELGVVDLALIDGLPQLAWAAWYSRYRYLLAGATHSGATLPAPLVERATETRVRMLKCLEYNLEDNADAMKIIKFLRAGGGHQDLANDLSTAAEMYKKHRGDIEHDRKNYRESDERGAAALSTEIVDLLGSTMSPEQTLWKGYQTRTAVLLVDHYTETLRVGRFLHHHDNPEGRFPSLFAATRSAAAPRVPKGGEAAEPETPAEPPAGEKPKGSGGG